MSRFASDVLFSSLTFLLCVASVFIGRTAFRSFQDKNFRQAFLLIGSFLLVVVAIIFTVNQTTPFRRTREVRSILEDRCKSAGQWIYKNVTDADGVFLEPDAGVSIIKNSSGRAYSTGVLGLSLVNLRLVKFYEISVKSDRGPKSDSKYLRFEYGGYKGKGINELESRYGILTTDIASQEEKKLGIVGAEVRIVALQANETVALARYFHSRRYGPAFCPDLALGWSTLDFVSEVLSGKRIQRHRS